MGMAASQARLLSLTNRMHDVELKAQQIQADKIALATQEDLVYQTYCDAMDATNIAVAYQDGLGTKLVDANFSTLCNFDENRMKQYALKDNNSGKLIVSENVKEMYDAYGNDKYSFAWAMLGLTDFGWDNQDMGLNVGIGTNNDVLPNGFTYGTNAAPGDENDSGDLYMTECEAMVYEEHQDDSDLTNKYQNILDAATTDDKRNALEDFRKYLYSKYSQEIFDNMNSNKNDGDGGEPILADTEWADVAKEFNYYINMWEAINQAGGCQVIDPQYECGEDGTTWLTNMVESGQLSIMVYGDTGHKNEWSETTVATSTTQNYLENQSDKAKQKKAEVQYEHDLRELDRKDSKYDTELSKLETERSAIKTEMDSIKTAIKENTERTFGIFS